MIKVWACGLALAILALAACSSGPTRYEQLGEVPSSESTSFRADPFYNGGVFDRETRTNQWPLSR